MYKRILLKLSGESLMGAQQYGIDPQRLAAQHTKYQSAIVPRCCTGFPVGQLFIRNYIRIQQFIPQRAQPGTQNNRNFRTISSTPVNILNCFIHMIH